MLRVVDIAKICHLAREVGAVTWWITPS
ncbi:hypothetical protein ACNKHX_24445 [Shigella flexneri]